MLAKRNPLCPICNEANGCAIASTGDLQAPCWCKLQKISLEALAKIPESERNQSCICVNCAGSFVLKSSD
ncbi:MAG: cysteine-rich CWC family protein [Methylophilaceae bacterium]|nr:cysteine-rich CWC family protein [Methyloradius sp.]